MNTEKYHPPVSRLLLSYFKEIPVKILRLLALCTGLVIALGTAGGVQGQTTLRFAQLVPPTHPYHTGILVPWIAEIERVTQGRVKVEITTAPMGPMSRNFDMVEQGIADIAGGNHSQSPGRFGLTQVPQTYVGVDSPESVSVAYWRTYKRFLEKADEHTNTHVLALHVSGAMHAFTTNKEIKSAADLKGLKVLAPGTVASKMATNLGAVPLIRPPPEYYDTVSKGIVDGVIGTNSVISGFKVEPLIKYHLDIPGGLHFSSFFVVVNKAKWDSLAKADRDAIDSVSGEAYAKLAGKVLAKQQDEALAARKSEGRIKTTVADVATVDAFRKALLFFDQEWVAAAKTAGVDGDAALKYFRDEAAAYEKTRR